MLLIRCHPNFGTSACLDPPTLCSMILLLTVSIRINWLMLIDMLLDTGGQLAQQHWLSTGMRSDAWVAIFLNIVDSLRTRHILSRLQTRRLQTFAQWQH